MKTKGDNKNLLEFYTKYCMDRGATINVSSDYYRWSGNLTDASMMRLIRIILLDRSEEIKRWMTAEPRMKGNQDIFDYIETILSNIAHGFVQIMDQNKLGCYTPVGPPPSESEAAEIDHRILAGRSMFPQAIREILGIRLLGEQSRYYSTL